MLLFVFGSVGRLGRGVCRLLTARANEQSALGLLEEVCATVRRLELEGNSLSRAVEPHGALCVCVCVCVCVWVCVCVCVSGGLIDDRFIDSHQVCVCQK